MEDTAKNETPHKRATKVGKVVSDSMNKSVVVEVGRRVEHGRSKRTIRRTSRFMAHDENNTAKVGDRVRIEETRPMSKRKRWILKEVLVKAEA
jgi:small subunit ribosomal protein S17